MSGFVPVPIGDALPGVRIRTLMVPATDRRGGEGLGLAPVGYCFGPDGAQVGWFFDPMALLYLAHETN